MKKLRQFTCSLILILATGCTVPNPELKVEEINVILHRDWQKTAMTPVPQAADEVFLRRARLDLTGRAPTCQEIQDFCKDKSPEKRAALIRRLLDTEEYADLMAMRYADLFRVKSEFPINLWPNAVQLYHRYLREAAKQDKPFRELAYEMLTASGSNFRVAPANFFRASADHTPEGLARVTTLTWLGIRLEKLPPEITADMAPFFSRISMKNTAEWKEQIVFLNPEPVKLKARTPDGKRFSMDTAEKDPRVCFAEWLIADYDLQFSKAWVNRAWYWIFGIPLSGAQPDDMPVPPGWRGSQKTQIPELNEKLLNLLAAEFHRTGGKMRLLLEKICLCDAYLADWKTVPAEQKTATAHFAVYPVRRHDAEVILDLLGDLTGHRESYRSVIPEPFTFLPKETRAVQVADGSISTSALDNFGRPPRDSGLAAERNNTVTSSQRLYLMNSASLYKDLSLLCDKKLLRQYKKLPQLVDACYYAVLSRPATKQEQKWVGEYANTLQEKGRKRTAVLDLLWSLVNSKEFLYHH